MLVTSVTAIANMVVEAMGFSGVKFIYTGGNRGWRGDVPQVRFDITKMKNLGLEVVVIASGAWQPDIIQMGL